MPAPVHRALSGPLVGELVPAVGEEGEVGRLGLDAERSGPRSAVSPSPHDDVFVQQTHLLAVAVRVF